MVDLVGAPCGPPCTPYMFTNVVINPENELMNPARNKLVNSHSILFLLRRQSKKTTTILTILHTKPRASL